MTEAEIFPYVTRIVNIVGRWRNINVLFLVTSINVIFICQPNKLETYKCIFLVGERNWANSKSCLLKLDGLILGDTARYIIECYHHALQLFTQLIYEKNTWHSSLHVP